MLECIKKLVPWPLRQRIKKLIGKKNQPDLRVRKDLKIISVDDRLRFLVYWKVLPIGKGPATILEIDNQEFAKFDCFGEKEGHFHISPYYNFRIFFHEITRKDQIDRTAKELLFNLELYLQWHPDPKYHVLKINREKMEEAVIKVKEIMLKTEEDIF